MKQMLKILTSLMVIMTLVVSPVFATSISINHYSSCSSVSRMSDKNKISMTRSEFINTGYDPCQRCNP